MNNRVNALANRVIQGGEALATFLETISDDEFVTIIPNEKRALGILAHHVAVSYPVEVDLASQLASGKPITGVTWDVIDGINADHARDTNQVNRQEVIELIRANAREAAERIRKFTDNELDQSASVSLYANAPLTAQFFIEDHALRHSYQHLESMRAALGR